MTPLSRWMAGKLPPALAWAGLVAVYTAMLFSLLVAGGGNMHDNLYVDVKGGKAARALPTQSPAKL